MIKFGRGRYLSLICIVALIFVTACGEVREAPKLIEPLADNQSFRPVERRTVGTLKVEVGHVVPKEYCHFYNRATTIKEICCDYGDYVEEGQILAVADTETLMEELEEMEAAYNLLLAEQPLKMSIHDVNIKILNTKRQACLYGYDDTGASEYTVEIKKEEENKTYDETLFTFMSDYYQKEIAELEKDIAQATIKAKEAGYVIYTKDTAKDSRVAKNEAVVIVADYEDVHIEVDGLNIGNNPYKKYEIKYALIDGVEVPIEEYEYTAQETIAAKAQEMYPNVRYKTSSPVDLKIGDTIALGFIIRKKDGVLAIGHDSVNTDDAGNYVYVKAGDNMEKRYVSLGAGDDFYSEVESGLEEGELVYYVQESSKPVNYKEYEVTRSHYIQKASAKNLHKAATINTAYFSKNNGKIKSIIFNQGEKYSKGDTLMVIDTGGGSANLEEVDTDRDHLRMDFEKSIKDSDKQITDLKTQNLRLLTSIEEGKDDNSIDERDIDIIECQRTVLLHQATLVEIEKQISNLEYQDQMRRINKKADKLKKDNDGQGDINIVAKDDGIVSRLYVTEGKRTEVGGENYLLLSGTKDSDTITSASVGKEIKMPFVGSRIEISPGNSDKVYKGIVVGSYQDGASFGFTENDKAYISFCHVTNSGTPIFNIKMEDESFIENEKLSDCSVSIVEIDISGAIVLPGKAVYFEDSKTKDEKRSFVWKTENGQLIKQYINIGTNYNIGNNNEVVVLSGISEGDILALESGSILVED